MRKIDRRNVGQLWSESNLTGLKLGGRSETQTHATKEVKAKGILHYLRG